MAKAVLISIRPEWVEKIMPGKKTLEVRKTRPKLEAPFKVYIYCTAGNLSYEVNNGMMCNISGGKLVAGEFVCDKIDCVDIPYPAFMGKLDKHWTEDSCCTYYQLHRYFYHDRAYFWHISSLEIYDTPKTLSAFKGLRKTKFGYAPVEMKRPPQSWCYVEELK
jgi:predicted transcriptional regulator